MNIFDESFFLRFEKKNLIEFIDARSHLKISDYLSSEDKIAIDRDLKYGNTGGFIKNLKSN